MGDTSSMDILTRLLPSMVIIVSALLLLRRWGRRGVRPDTAVRVVARTGVTRNAVVAIVEVSGQRYLVGAGEDGVRLLADLDAVPPAGSEPPPARETVGQSSPSPTPAPRARAWPQPRLVHRLQQMTVRTHVEASVREHL